MSQLYTAGGTVCVRLPNVWKAFLNAVYTYECCVGVSRRDVDAGNNTETCILEKFGEDPRNGVAFNSCNKVLVFLLTLLYFIN